MNATTALLAAFVIVVVVNSIHDGILIRMLVRWLISAATATPGGPSGALHPQVPVAPGAGGGAAAPPPVSAPTKPLPRNRGITATDFAGANDSAISRTSAYTGKPIDGDTQLGVALPARFPGSAPTVRIFYNGRSIDAPVLDVGPWNTNDPYWGHGARPQAETGTDTRGRKTNLAGIDLTPATWVALGVKGDPRNVKAKVDWDFASVLDGPSSTPGLLVASTAGLVLSEPPWLPLARADIGFHEIGNNQGTQKFVDQAGFGAVGEPWCSIWAAGKMRQAGVDIEGVNAMALSWTTAKSMHKIATPVPGCVAVFDRGGGQGHVGFYVGDADANHINVLGGNESDQVKIEAFSKNSASMRLLGYWMPNSYQQPGDPKVT
jgi:uncharacterized protein (TIGR02594 family)